MDLKILTTVCYVCPIQKHNRLTFTLQELTSPNTLYYMN